MRLGLRIVAVALATARAASARCDEADGCLCVDDRATCVFVDDGECDDGGPGSDSAECKLGYDCTDCGNRQDGVGGPFLCKNRCGANTRDGVCDDGGPGSLAHPGLCDFGHDCDDCGARQTEDSCVNGQMEMCHDTRSGMFACSFVRDGVCDDGGEGSSFHHCSLGTDCADCNGPRTQACGPGVEYEPDQTYSYGGSTGGDGTTAMCVGDPGVPMCDERQCQEWKRPNCLSCMCMMCDFCASTLQSVTSPPPPHPQPPPPDAFSCDMLDDRDNLKRQSSSDAQCYSVFRDEAKCARSYTYDAYSEDGPDLRLCLARSDGMCESWPIEPSLYTSDYCQSKLWFPPPPPSPPPSPNPPPPPSMPPPSPPPSPPSPPPCLPRSAKCGGHGWTGLTNCCVDSGAFGYTSCIKQNEYRSQCRDDCPPDWDCQHMPRYGMPESAWYMYRVMGGATPTPSPEPEVDAGEGAVTDIEQELESPPPSPPPPTAAKQQQPEHPQTPTPSGLDSSQADGRAAPSSPQHSSSGLVAGLVIAALLVVCVGLLCRRWAQRGAQMRKGNRLHDETVAEASEWAQEERGLEMIDDEPPSTRL